MLYEDGMNLEDEEDGQQKKTFYDFIVDVMYKQIGGNDFFDKFVSKHYQREINVWKHEREKVQELTENEQIFHVLQKRDFGLFFLFLFLSISMKVCVFILSIQKQPISTPTAPKGSTSMNSRPFSRDCDIR